MESTIREHLASTCISQFRYYDTVDSTNNQALRWLNEGATDYSLVVANEQTGGRGRFNRRWITNPGSALAFSLVLTPHESEKTKAALFSPLCGLAVCSAILECYGINAEIKWPNDVLLNRKKVAGILVEAEWVNSNLKGIVLGIGVNILRASIPASEFQRFDATCIEDESGVVPDRYHLLSRIIHAIQFWRSRIGSGEFFTAWQEKLAFRNEMVCIEQSEKQSIIGKEIGIDDQGNLVLLVGESEAHFEVGDVHLTPCVFRGLEEKC